MKTTWMIAISKDESDGMYSLVKHTEGQRPIFVGYSTQSIGNIITGLSGVLRFGDVVIEPTGSTYHYLRPEYRTSQRN